LPIFLSTAHQQIILPTAISSIIQQEKIKEVRQHKHSFVPHTVFAKARNAMLDVFAVTGGQRVFRSEAGCVGNLG
jgi:hypothetical protein